MRLMLVGLVVGVLSPAVASAAAPTFSKDVAPILYKSCIDCHRPGAIAPMSLGGTHVTEAGGLSTALREVWLPARERAVRALLAP